MENVFLVRGGYRCAKLIVKADTRNERECFQKHKNRKTRPTFFKRCTAGSVVKKMFRNVTTTVRYFELLSLLNSFSVIRKKIIESNRCRVTGD